jgi:hypothetical protein
MGLLFRIRRNVGAGKQVVFFNEVRLTLILFGTIK